MSEKAGKRKRAGADVERARKRQAGEPAAGHIRVDVKNVAAAYRPALASAPGLRLRDHTFNGYVKTGEDNSEQPVLLHSSDHPRLDYTGTTDLAQPVRHILGIFDPQERSLQLVPAHNLTVRSTLWEEELEVETENANRSNMQQRMTLGMEFGTKKAKRAIADKTINAIGAGVSKDVEAATLEGIESSAGLPTKDQLHIDVLASKPIPRPNLETEVLGEVYPLDTLIPSADLRAQQVKAWQDTVKANEAVEVSSRFVANRIRRLVDREDVQRMKALKYLLLLIEFANCLQFSKQGRKVPKKEQLNTQLSEWPDVAVESLRRRFAEGGELNKWHHDRLMTHAAAISLYIDGYRTEISDLREDLRQENRQMQQYFLELGCKTRSPYESEYAELKIQNKAHAAQKKMAVLKLPLEFPKTRNPPRRR